MIVFCHRQRFTCIPRQFVSQIFIVDCLYSLHISLWTLIANQKSNFITLYSTCRVKRFFLEMILVRCSRTPNSSQIQSTVYTERDLVLKITWIIYCKIWVQNTWYSHLRITNISISIFFSRFVEFWIAFWLKLQLSYHIFINWFRLNEVILESRSTSNSFLWIGIYIVEIEWHCSKYHTLLLQINHK